MRRSSSTSGPLPNSKQRWDLKTPGAVLARVGLAAVYAKQLRLDEAERLCPAALPDLQQAFGARHPAVASGLRNLAAIDFRLRSYADAESNYRRAIAIQEAVLGKGHADLTETL